jgi:hypothetical protein
MISRRTSPVVASLFAALAFGGISSTHAALVVHEGFDYGPVPSLLNGLGNTTEVGLQGTWTYNGTNGTTVSYDPTGLTFSDLVVTGGLAQLNGVAGAGDRIAAVGRQLNVDAQSGTIWGSYLFRPISDLTTRSVGSLLQGNAANVSDNTAYFSLANNEFNQNIGGVRVSNTIGGGSALATGGVIPSLATTYLYVFRLDNIGAPSGTTQTATAWMMSELQYDNFKSGGLDESELNGALIGTFDTNIMQRVSFTTANPLANPGTFDNTDFLRLFNFGGAEFITQYDELKFSNSNVNEAVQGVPEPSAALAMAGGIGLLLGLRRRTRC